MAERPTAANRPMAKRTREPLADTNSVISEPTIEKGLVLLHACFDIWTLDVSLLSFYRLKHIFSFLDSASFQAMPLKASLFRWKYFPFWRRKKTTNGPANDSLWAYDGQEATPGSKQCPSHALGAKVCSLYTRTRSADHSTSSSHWKYDAPSSISSKKHRYCNEARCSRCSQRGTERCTNPRPLQHEISSTETGWSKALLGLWG